jgi:ketosteroid isomerase-like protein
MKRMAVAFAFLLLSAGLIFAQAKPQAPSVGQEIAALENAWNDASMKYDVSWFQAHLADTYSGMDENGVAGDKSKVLADVKDRLGKFESMTLENFKVRVYGDTAIATGIFVVKGTYKGKDASGKFPYTDVWIKLGGRWQCVAGHNSKLPAK